MGYYYIDGDAFRPRSLVNGGIKSRLGWIWGKVCVELGVLVRFEKVKVHEWWCLC